jgi:uncharacterized membrane protein
MQAYLKTAIAFDWLFGLEYLMRVVCLFFFLFYSHHQQQQRYISTCFCVVWLRLTASISIVALSLSLILAARMTKLLTRRMNNDDHENLY